MGYQVSDSLLLQTIQSFFLICPKELARLKEDMHGVSIDFRAFDNTQYGKHHWHLLLLLLRFLLLLLFCRRQQTVYEFVAPRSPAKIKFIQIPSSPCWDDLPTIKMPTMVYFIFVLFLFFHARCFWSLKECNINFWSIICVWVCRWIDAFDLLRVVKITVINFFDLLSKQMRVCRCAKIDQYLFCSFFVPQNKTIHSSHKNKNRNFKKANNNNNNNNKTTKQKSKHPQNKKYKIQKKHEKKSKWNSPLPR